MNRASILFALLTALFVAAQAQNAAPAEPPPQPPSIQAYQYALDAAKAQIEKLTNELAQAREKIALLESALARHQGAPVDYGQLHAQEQAERQARLAAARQRLHEQEQERLRQLQQQRLAEQQAAEAAANAPA